MIDSKSDKIFYIINYIVLGIIGLVTLYPFINILAVSLSNPGQVAAGNVTIFPKEFTTVAYNLVMNNPRFWSALKISGFVTIVGTIISVAIVALAAYPASKKELPFRTPIMIFFVIVMLFSGGIVPNFILVRAIGLYNTRWALVLPSALQVYHLLLIKNYLETLPKELEESAKIDGASNRQILLQVLLPLSLPVLASVSLFTAVIYWNNYFNALLYVSDTSLQPLPYYIYQLIQYYSAPPIDNPDLAAKLDKNTIQAATIVSSIIPILLVYPFLQRYFVKGIVVGSVKG